jgi:uncharacterized RDD family membrane protein YckC
MSNFPNASLIRRFAAILYDGFLVVAVWMISTIILVATVTDGGEVKGPLYQAVLYIELGVFYVYFWHFRGQTLGMQVWKIRCVDETGESPGLEDCIKRFLFATVSSAPMGLGFLWVFLNPQRLAWHDIASHTRVIYMGAKPYASEVVEDSQPEENSVGSAEQHITNDETENNGNDRSDDR